LGHQRPGLRLQLGDSSQRTAAEVVVVSHGTGFADIDVRGE
jgi:hypothetical protein